ncbi:MAG TPA: acyl-CoA dehydrogenase family protein [Candidatus Methylomirabilis sp.]|nr:acyl-CoA dehydrogenase family protein [Candidatus Methylomirabilis sp.]
MDFAPTALQERWIGEARSFADAHMRPQADRWDERGEFPLDCFREAAKLGFAGLFAPAEVGGQALDAVTACLIYEALGRGCFATTFGMVVHNNFVRSLARAGTAAARERWLAAATRGELIGAFALTEPGAGSDAAAIETTAVRERGGFRLDGVKAWVSNGGTADLYTVMARTAAPGRSRAISSFVVERGSPGVSFGPPDRKIAAGALPTCRMTLRNVWVPEENLLGAEGEGLRSALATIDVARAVVAAMATGIAAAALDEAVAYARSRRAFGRPIAEFQGLQFPLAEAAAKVEAARWLAYRAAWLCDRGLAAAEASAMAKLVAVETAEQVCSRAVDVFGANGLLRDHPVERYYRWAKVAAFLDGTQQIQQVVITRRLFASPDAVPRSRPERPPADGQG